MFNTNDKKRKRSEDDDTHNDKKRKLKDDTNATLRLSINDRLRTLLTLSHQKILGENQAALKRFQMSQTTADDIIIYDNIDYVKANVESEQQTIENLQSYNLLGLLNHAITVDEYVINKNKEKFEEILNIFITNFHLLCPEDEKTKYLERVDDICKEHGYDNLKQRTAELQKDLKNISTVKL
jgi:hypothetical protein